MVSENMAKLLFEKVKSLYHTIFKINSRLIIFLFLVIQSCIKTIRGYLYNSGWFLG